MEKGGGGGRKKQGDISSCDLFYKDKGDLFDIKGNVD